MRSKLELEFDTYSAWLVESLADLEPEDVIAGTCRGTGNPELLERVADSLDVGPDSLVLDVGSGLGGPSAWLGRERGCRVVGVDVIETEVRAAARLFPETTPVVAGAERLPWRDASFDAVCSLGVIEMVANKRDALGELSRVLKPGGGVAIYGFFATDKPFRHAPTANHFVKAEGLISDLERSGVRLVEASRCRYSPAPDSWRRATAALRADVDRRHQGDDRLTLAQAQLGSFNWLRTSRCIEDWLLVGERAGP